MSKPTQAQIGAGLAVFADHYWDSFNADKFLILQHIKETLPRALTAAAEVEDDYKPIYDSPNNRVRAAVAATIERCAKVVAVFDECDAYSKEDGLHITKHIAAAIRALADKPQPDPNIIYPGEDLTNVFPEEEP